MTGFSLKRAAASRRPKCSQHWRLVPYPGGATGRDGFALDRTIRFWLYFRLAGETKSKARSA